MRQTFTNILDARDAIATHAGAACYIGAFEDHAPDAVRLAIVRAEDSGRIVGTICETTDTYGAQRCDAMACLPRGIH